MTQEERIEALEARLDKLCSQMNNFVIEIRSGIAELLGAKVQETNVNQN